VRRLVCLTALALVAGCGGGSDKPSATSTSAPASSSRDEVVASTGATLASSTRGRKILNVVPNCGSLHTSIDPPLCVTIP